MNHALAQEDLDVTPAKVPTSLPHFCLTKPTLTAVALWINRLMEPAFCVSYLNGHHPSQSVPGPVQLYSTAKSINWPSPFTYIQCTPHLAIHLCGRPSVCPSVSTSICPYTYVWSPICPLMRWASVAYSDNQLDYWSTGCASDPSLKA